MSEQLDQAAQNLRIKKDELDRAKTAHDTAKAEFVRLLHAEYDDGQKVEFVASDGYRYGRIYAEVGGGIDFERMKQEETELALMVSKIVLDPEAVERVVEMFPDTLPKFQKYAVAPKLQERLLPITKPKEEEASE